MLLFLQDQVITNYVASAGFAVLVILLYFFVAFDPTVDPFAKDEKSVDDPPFRPNVIDLLLTRKVRGSFPGCMSGCLKKRWEKSFVKVQYCHSSLVYFLSTRPPLSQTSVLLQWVIFNLSRGSQS
jgi:hypothetical protein